MSDGSTSLSQNYRDQVNRSVEAAEEAFWSFGYCDRAVRSKFLSAIANHIEANAEAIVAVSQKESALPEARMRGELGRTTGQLRMFADHIQSNDYLDIRHDAALPDRAPLPRPEMFLMQRPIGPVAVFGASNFPLAFSTAGGDTASALAAGCPVVVKAHEAHPETTTLVAAAVENAIRECDLHHGVFSVIQGEGNEIGAALVQHPLIKAVGFTGSLRGGRALFDLCAARAEPIPFFGELGSINPVFVLDNALADRGNMIANGWAASLTMGAGQFCTNPGVLFLPAGETANAFVEAAKEALDQVGPQTMLTDGIAAAYCKGRDQIAGTSGVATQVFTDVSGRIAGSALFVTDGQTWLTTASLEDEVFGPLGIVVTVSSVDEMQKIARNLQGQLTCTLMIDDADISTATALMPVLERKAGRILANGFPTGVEVCDSMVHGGPYPASTNFGATSVGSMAIRRFLRPVSYQNLPQYLHPVDL
jgi:NADP-dependent aldehyde dehydrogenase